MYLNCCSKREVIVITNRWIFSKTYRTFKQKDFAKQNIFILHTYVRFRCLHVCGKWTHTLLPYQKGRNQKPFLLPLNFPFPYNNNMQHFFRIYTGFNNNKKNSDVYSGKILYTYVIFFLYNNSMKRFQKVLLLYS